MDRISTPHLIPVEVADAVWLRHTDHLARANTASVIERFDCPVLLDDDIAVDSAPTCVYAAAPLNVNLDVAPLSLTTLLPMVPKATTGVAWHAAEAAKIDRLLDTTTMHAIHLYQ